MPKKKRARSSRPNTSSTRIQRAPVIQKEPGIADRLRKNPFAVLLGLIVVLSMVLALAGDIFLGGQAAPAATPPAPAAPTAQAGAPKQYSAAPAMTIDPNKTYTATVVTNKGTIKLQLDAKLAPQHVNNFVFLARDGFYNGVKFHRVESWVIQTGDPTGTGGGGPGYTIPLEVNGGHHITGTLGMARSNDPNSAGSQWYIVKSPQPGLDSGYTVFGQTIEGMDVVNSIVQGDVVQSVTIEEK